jgi:hypothetical protein
MSGCECFKVKNQYIESNENRGHGQYDPLVVKIPYCVHEQSPVTLNQTAVIGGANLLRCGGHLENCQIPKNN